MIRIGISAAAYAAIARSLSADAKPQRLKSGVVWIWLPKAVVEGLRRARGPHESYSDVILRHAAAERGEGQ